MRALMDNFPLLNQLPIFQFPDMCESTRLLLRRPRVDHVAAVFAIHGDPETSRYNPAGPLKNIEQAQSTVNTWQHQWQQRGHGMWIIALKDNPEQVIGFGGLTHKMYGETERLNLGYRFTPSVWGRGLASELAAFALIQAFETLRVEQVCAIVRPKNLVSRKVLERIGMCVVEELDEVPGEECSLIYRVTKQEFYERSARL